MAHYNLGNALRPRGSSTRPSPNTARRSGSSPTSPRPTTTSASPCVPGEARRGDRRIPRGDPAQARPRRAHNNLGIALDGQGKLDEADRRIPRGDPAEARPRRGPLQPRHRPGRRGSSTRPSPNTARRSGSSPTTPRPTQPRHRPERPGKLDEAIAEFRTAIRLKPDHAEAHSNLGTPWRRGKATGRGDRRIPRRRSGSSPTTPRPTATSATPSECKGSRRRLTCFRQWARTGLAAAGWRYSFRAMVSRPSSRRALVRAVSGHPRRH